MQNTNNFRVSNKEKVTPECLKVYNCQGPSYLEEGDAEAGIRITEFRKAVLNVRKGEIEPASIRSCKETVGF